MKEDGLSHGVDGVSVPDGCHAGTACHVATKIVSSVQLLSDGFKIKGIPRPGMVRLAPVQCRGVVFGRLPDIIVVGSGPGDQIKLQIVGLAFAVHPVDDDIA